MLQICLGRCKMHQLWTDWSGLLGGTFAGADPKDSSPGSNSWCRWVPFIDGCVFVDVDGCGIGIGNRLLAGFPHCHVDISRKHPIRHSSRHSIWSFRRSGSVQAQLRQGLFVCSRGWVTPVWYWNSDIYDMRFWMHLDDRVVQSDLGSHAQAFQTIEDLQSVKTFELQEVV